MIKDSNRNEVKIGDKVFGEGYLECQDGFKIDRTPVVTVTKQRGRIYFGKLSKESFDKFWLATEKNKAAHSTQKGF